MSTRGAVGIIYDGIEKIGYNHFDSYPTGLGNDVLNYLYNKNLPYMINVFYSIDLNEDAMNDVFDNGKFNTSFPNRKSVLGDSLFCEWAYIINLDTKKLEVYRGFNKDKNAEGRYAHLKNNGNSKYYGVKLIYEYDLNDLFCDKKSFRKEDDGQLN